jgi:hypothetical protein
MAGADEVTDEVAIWSGVVETLPLRKKRFEAGEVVAPPPSSVDWSAVRAAAFVSLSCWPEAEACQFLQSLYYGVYLGDERGTMLDLLEA